MKYEHFTDPLAPKNVWWARVWQSFGFASVLLVTALLLGIFGYHFIGKLSWIDALLEASMILGGMGPVATMNSSTIKIFASLYALFSGFILLSSFSIFTVPWLHRLLHHFHIQAPKN